jgi:hypothetical protein
MICDGCYDEDWVEVPKDVLSHGVRKQLEQTGWLPIGENDLCSVCARDPEMVKRFRRELEASEAATNLLRAKARMARAKST